MSDDPKPQRSTIYIDVEDDIAAIIDKVEAAKQNVVAVVLPKRSSVMQSIVNMRLLKRSAKAADKKITLVTTEAALLPLAGAAELPVAESLSDLPAVPEAPSRPAISSTPLKITGADMPAKAKIDYAEPPAGLAAAAIEKDDEPETISLEDKTAEPVTKPVKKPKSPSGRMVKIPNFDSFRNRLGLTIILLIALILFFIVGGKVLPKATVTISTTSSPVAGSINLTTSDKAKKLDLKSDTIPAQLKTTDQSTTQQVNATGSQNLGKKATGSVRFSAGPCSATIPESVPAGSATTSNGLTYITQSTANFGADLSSGTCQWTANSVAITAQTGGSNFNVSSGTFAVPGRSDVSGSGSASGGTDNNVTVLSQSDVNNAVKQLTSTSSSKSLVSKFEQQLSDQGLYVLTSTLKTGSPKVTATPAVGQQTSSSTLAIKITYSVLTVSKDDLTKAITSALNAQIDTAHQKLADGDLLQSADVSITDQTSPTVASITVTDKTTAVPQLDTNAVKSQIEGKKSGDIQAALSTLPGVTAVNVHLSPFWVSTAPKNASKIKIVLQETAASTTTNSNNQNSTP